MTIFTCPKCGCQDCLNNECCDCGLKVMPKPSRWKPANGYVRENDIHYEQKEEVEPRGVSREDIDNLSSKPMERSYGRKKPAGMRIIPNPYINIK